MEMYTSTQLLEHVAHDSSRIDAEHVAHNSSHIDPETSPQLVSS